MITHYQRILKYVKPQFVHVMYQGEIIKSGGRGPLETSRGERIQLDYRVPGRDCCGPQNRNPA